MHASLYCLEVDSAAEIEARIDDIFAQVFRTNFDPPGFALLSFPQPILPHDLRRAMVDLKRSLSAQLFDESGRQLSYLSMGRFDQQNTTKFHLDGAPEESILMLGYEPSRVRSRLFMADYSKCAHTLGLTPREFLEHHNPMYAAGAKLLEPHVTQVECFNPSFAQIVVINNSSAAMDGVGLQGVMHQAIIDTPNAALQRVVNSTMLEVSIDVRELKTVSEQDAFIASDAISAPIKY